MWRPYHATVTCYAQGTAPNRRPAHDRGFPATVLKFLVTDIVINPSTQPWAHRFTPALVVETDEQALCLYAQVARA